MKMIKSTLLIFLLTGSQILGYCQIQYSFNEEDELLEQLSVDHQITGVAAGYSINGQVFWKKSLGWSDEYKRVPFSELTLTRMASIAKPMTALAVMQLVEKGLVELDVPIQSYLPDYPTKKKGNITVRHLLSHTSGIDGYKNAKEAETKNHYADLQTAANVFIDRKLLFSPGSKFSYTTYGYVLLGLIIEKVSGMSYEEYMSQNIWTPAGMKNTGVEHFEMDYQNKSQLYHFEKGKTKLGKQNNLSNRIPGGGFYTTLEDMLKFGNAVLNNLLVKEATLLKMLEIHSQNKEGNPYGLGWFMYAPAPDQNIVIGHSGEQTGSSAQIMIRRDNKTVVVVLANTSGKWKEVIQLTANLLGLSKDKVSDSQIK